MAAANPPVTRMCPFGAVVTFTKVDQTVMLPWGGVANASLAAAGGRTAIKLAGRGGLAGHGGLAGRHGGLAG